MLSRSMRKLAIASSKVGKEGRDYSGCGLRVPFMIAGQDEASFTSSSARSHVISRIYVLDQSDARFFSTERPVPARRPLRGESRRLAPDIQRIRAHASPRARRNPLA